MASMQFCAVNYGLMLDRRDVDLLRSMCDAITDTLEQRPGDFPVDTASTASSIVPQLQRVLWCSCSAIVLSFDWYTLSGFYDGVNRRIFGFDD